MTMKTCQDLKLKKGILLFLFKEEEIVDSLRSMGVQSYNGCRSMIRGQGRDQWGPLEIWQLKLYVKSKRNRTSSKIKCSLKQLNCFINLQLHPTIRYFHMVCNMVYVGLPLILPENSFSRGIVWTPNRHITEPGPTSGSGCKEPRCGCCARTSHAASGYRSKTSPRQTSRLVGTFASRVNQFYSGDGHCLPLRRGALGNQRLIGLRRKWWNLHGPLRVSTTLPLWE